MERDLVFVGDGLRFKIRYDPNLLVNRALCFSYNSLVCKIGDLKVSFKLCYFFFHWKVSIMDLQCLNID